MASPAGHGAVLYAKDLQRVARFYRSVFDMRVIVTDDVREVLQQADFQLVVHAIPEQIARTVDIAVPPVRRTDGAVKLFLSVVDLAAARTLAGTLGGRIDPADREWDLLDVRVCDGMDPEGNVIQARQRQSR